MAAAHLGPVVAIVTAEDRDDEMHARIEEHRRDRPTGWTVVEEPLELERVILAAPADAAMVIDCLTLWVSNRFEAGSSDDEIEELSRTAATAAAGRAAPTYAVTNEVGSGIVPMSAVARRYRDVLGAVNRVWAEAAKHAWLVVAGRVLPLAVPEELER
jgi:adenosyl cobinamide kinase/adenosyl cobinamide phosphate guanylyltransferase